MKQTLHGALEHGWSVLWFFGFFFFIYIVDSCESPVLTRAFIRGFCYILLQAQDHACVCSEKSLRIGQKEVLLLASQ